MRDLEEQLEHPPPPRRHVILIYSQRRRTGQAAIVCECLVSGQQRIVLIGTIRSWLPLSIHAPAATNSGQSCTLNNVQHDSKRHEASPSSNPEASPMPGHDLKPQQEDGDEQDKRLEASGSLCVYVT